MTTYLRDSDSILDYRCDWSSWLDDGEVIASSSWVVPAGLTKNSDTHDTTTATVWISGGVNGQNYTLTNRVTTTAGRTDDRSITLMVRQR